MKGNYLENSLFWSFHEYKSDIHKIENRIKDSDVLITDGTHRIVGLSYKIEVFDAPSVTVQCLRNEVAYAKHVAFSNGIKVVENRKLSALLFGKYAVGDFIQSEDFSSVAKVYSKIEKFKKMR